MTRGAEEFGIGSEKLLQRLWIPAGDRTYCAGSLVGHLTFPEGLPEMGQMIERVRIDSRPHCLSPLLVCDGYIANGPAHHPTESFDNIPHRWRLVHHWVNILGRQAGACQESCGHAGYVFRTGERDDGLFIAPRQKSSILFGDSTADQSAHVFIIGRRLDMNGPNLRPVEDTIGQPMLQIAERGGVMEVSKCGIIGRALKLRI